MSSKELRYEYNRLAIGRECSRHCGRKRYSPYHTYCRPCWNEINREIQRLRRTPEGREGRKAYHAKRIGQSCSNAKHGCKGKRYSLYHGYCLKCRNEIARAWAAAHPRPQRILTTPLPD